MRVKSLYLKNFRCFKDIGISFDNQLTVLVGTNGAGKTTILDALSVVLKWAGNPDTRSGQCPISLTDIAIGCKPEDVVHHLVLEPEKSDDINELAISLNYGNNGSAAIGYRSPNLPETFDKCMNEASPVFVAYMAGRYIDEKDSVLRTNIYAPSPYSAFENNFERTIDYASTLSWFNNVDGDEARDMRDNGHKNESPVLRAVRAALSQALLGQYEKPRMQGHPPELIIYHKDTGAEYKVSQLSDGYRAMLALVMDLARRMAESRSNDINPHSYILNTSAIVLIDEIELHLHPSWQQTTLNTLMEIFPNTQFIVTTHSPQVLTSIPYKHIRILKDGNAHILNLQTQGAEASQLLKYVFEVEPRPNHLEIVRNLNNYAGLVYADKWDAQEAGKLRERLEEHFGNDELTLMELDLYIENKKWERGL